MSTNWTLKSISKAALKSSVSSFVRNEAGSMTYFGLAIIMMMLLVGGIGVDLMRNEMERTRVQATLDRAVLAAADLDQPLDATAVVEDYLAKSGLGHYTVSVNPDASVQYKGINYKTVVASTRNTTPTQFMRLVGVSDLPLSIASSAEERISKVEISLILDISGSMKNDSKIENMRTAGKAFVDAVIKPETQDLISLSIVPYSEHVNIGDGIYNNLKRYVYSNIPSRCVEMPDDEFEDTALDTSLWYRQVQHFQWNYASRYTVTDTVCPKYSYEAIQMVSQNKTALKNQIQALQPRAGTAIYMGMKWGVALLDPSMRTIVTNNKVSTDPLKGRPVDYSDEETLKTIVLMTDGQNSNSNRISNWAYNSYSERQQWVNQNFGWWNSHVYDNWNGGKGSPDYQYMTADRADDLLEDICDAAKAKGIVIWTVGFETKAHGGQVMEDCASSPSHYFDVEGVEIKEAFEAIAKQINQLRLTK
ncbi:TadE/TadG family type IV pilus assembly protein [uncultured Tateyamaria sp.]|uniref:TadE/TadG family type IV pilus assembly protein n=1 Tax=uncultured Tateyamaria sp. TaxID=455651 RepID=UPI00262F4D9C|nr:TadE/TadG family type IV pilus assembly protein [uncultured Tateyamaria sp.]